MKPVVKNYAASRGLKHIRFNLFEETKTETPVYILSHKDGSWFGISRNIWLNDLAPYPKSEIVLLRGKMPLQLYQPVISEYIRGLSAPHGHYNLNIPLLEERQKQRSAPKNQRGFKEEADVLFLKLQTCLALGAPDSPQIIALNGSLGALQMLFKSL